MKQSKGFSLIELMIVVAIVGILGTIAMGFYGDNVIASNRTDARSALTDTAGSLEKCKSLYGAYNHANCNVIFPVATEKNYYSITAPTRTATTFTLSAAPVGVPQSNDTDCTSLTLTNTGVKAGTPATNECW